MSHTAAACQHALFAVRRSQACRELTARHARSNTAPDG